VTRVIGLVAIDKRYATIGVLRGDEIEPLRHLSSIVSGGGFKKVDLAQARRDYFARVEAAAISAFAYIDSVLVGGPSPTKETFIAGIGANLRNKIIGTVNISYADESGLHELVQEYDGDSK
jgi:peptide subunit release factor 1 (eRF1)